MQMSYFAYEICINCHYFFVKKSETKQTNMEEFRTVAEKMSD